MTFEWPIALVSVAAVPAAVFAYLVLDRRRRHTAARWATPALMPNMVAGAPGRIRHLPAADALAALAAMLIALARPHATLAVPREQATVVLAIDVSGSMMADDVRPTRLEAAQEVVRTVLDDLPAKFRVGMVAFAGEPQVVAPVTTDRELVHQSLELLTPLRGTAIGDSVARAAQLASEATGGPRDRRLASVAAPSAASGAPAAVLLLSDGFQTQGTLTPLDGAARARELGIPVYTVALGTDDAVLDFGFRQIPVPPDRQTLRQIAEDTDGKYYDARTADALSSAYEDLGSLLATEPGELEATFAFLAAAAALALAAASLSVLWFSRIP